MKKFLFIILITLVTFFGCKVALLHYKITVLTEKISNQGAQREALQDCIDTAHGAYQAYFDSYIENTGSALYPNYKIDRNTRNWLDKRLRDDTADCRKQFGTN